LSNWNKNRRLEAAAEGIDVQMIVSHSPAAISQSARRNIIAYTFAFFLSFASERRHDGLPAARQRFCKVTCDNVPNAACRMTAQPQLFRLAGCDATDDDEPMWRHSIGGKKSKSVALNFLFRLPLLRNSACAELNAGDWTRDEAGT
jgi:hypothetical protein